MVNETTTPSYNVTFNSAPSNRSLTVDVTPCTTPCILPLLQGTHTITAATQSGKSGTQYAFASWSDEGLAAHCITVNSAATYTAYFTTQYTLTTAVSPAGSGTVSPQRRLVQ